MGGTGISWTICKSAPWSRHTTMAASHHSVFLRARCPSCRPSNSVKALKASASNQLINAVRFKQRTSCRVLNVFNFYLINLTNYAFYNSCRSTIWSPEFRLVFANYPNLNIRCFEVSRQHRWKTRDGKLQVQYTICLNHSTNINISQHRHKMHAYTFKHTVTYSCYAKQIFKT